MFSHLWSKVKEWIQKMIGPKTVEQVLDVTPIISNKMAEAIQLWADMYEDHAPWLHEPTFNDPTCIMSLGLPAFIASEKARMATLEMKSEISVPIEVTTEQNPNYTPPTMNEFGEMESSGEPMTITTETPTGPSERAEWLNTQYNRLLSVIRTQLEYGVAKGGLVIKPYIVLTKNDNNESKSENTISVDGDIVNNAAKIEFEFIHADAFFPLAFDGSGKVTEAAFVQTKVDKNTVYRRVEYHKLEGNKVIVKNKVFRSQNTNTTNDIINQSDLGTEINLKDVPEWKDLQPETTIENVDRLLFAYFKMPEANTVDASSPLGVSAFSRAVTLIREADKQFSRLQWEMEAGEMAIDIDRDALMETQDEHGNYHTVLNHMQRRLYRKIDLGESNTYQPYSPALRDGSLINDLNTILMRIEDVCALSRGTISDVAAEARTATELKILKQRSYSANAEIQKALEETLKDVVYIMNVYATLYGVVADGEYDVSFEWDDSILVDVDAELTKRITLMQNGLTSKLEVRMWYFGETENQAREALQKIADANKQSMENEMMVSSKPRE